MAALKRFTAAKTCENRVVHMRRGKTFICGRLAHAQFEGKWRCKRHYHEAKERAERRALVMAEAQCLR